MQIHYWAHMLDECYLNEAKTIIKDVESKLHSINENQEDNK